MYGNKIPVRGFRLLHERDLACYTSIIFFSGVHCSLCKGWGGGGVPFDKGYSLWVKIEAHTVYNCKLNENKLLAYDGKHIA